MKTLASFVCESNGLHAVSSDLARDSYVQYVNAVHLRFGSYTPHKELFMVFLYRGVRDLA